MWNMFIVQGCAVLLSFKVFPEPPESFCSCLKTSSGSFPITVQVTCAINLKSLFGVKVVMLTATCSQLQEVLLREEKVFREFHRGSFLYIKGLIGLILLAGSSVRAIWGPISYLWMVYRLAQLTGFNETVTRL